LTGAGAGASLPEVGGTFLDETVVSAAGGGRYEGEIAEAWCLRPLPQGGVVSAIALRALAAELDDAHQRLRTLHTTFAAQVTAGPVEVDVEVGYEGPVPTEFEVGLKLPAGLDDEQRRRLLVIATKCPVHKVIAGEAHVNVTERLEPA
jgi:hypothetical protein